MRWEELLDEARTDARRGERSRGRWLDQQARESATLVGSLVDLGEAGARLALRLDGGHRADGGVTLVGTDVVALDDGGQPVVVATSAITVVRPAPGGTAMAATGERPAAVDITVGEVLARIAAESPSVAIGLRDGEVVRGALVAVGTDLLSVQIGQGPGSAAYVSVAAVSVVRLG